jgi:peroxiredoxin
LPKLRGQVVVLHFWTFGCINCKHNLPALRSWNQKYADKGVTIIGVHTPETAREKQTGNVRRAVEENRSMYPIVLDGDARTWKTWDNRWWPCTYLIDKNGFVRYRWDEFNWKGETGEAVMRTKIDELLAEPAPHT